MSVEIPLPSVPELLADPARLLTYTPVAHTQSTVLDALLQEYQQLHFDTTLNQAVALLEKGDPRQLERRASWIQRFFGADIEREVDYYLSCLQVDELLELGDTQFERLNTFILQLDPLWRSVAQEGELLSAYLDRYREVLAELERNPDPLVKMPQGAAVFPGIGDGPDAALDALRRRLAEKQILEMRKTFEKQIGSVTRSRAALDEIYPQTRHQRCWVHKTANILNELPKRLQGKAKAALQAIWMADTREAAEKAWQAFVRDYQAKYPRAVAKLEKDRDVLLTFFDFPAEHWRHIRSSNAIESTFATVRQRSSRTKNCVSRATFLGLSYKLIQQAERHWRGIQHPERLRELFAGVTFVDGMPANETRLDPQQDAA